MIEWERRMEAETMYYMAICDDDKNNLDMIIKMVENVRKTENYRFDIQTYTNSRTLMADIEEGKHFELILSDIEMPELSGMELVKRLKEYLPDSIVIFVTSHLQYSVDSFELSVFRYILKHTLEEKLPKALSDAVRLLEYQSDKSYVIQTRDRVEKILYNRILYAKREGKNTLFTLMNQAETRVRKSLSQVYQELDTEDFVFIDRGCIVNLSYVVSLKNGIVEMKDGNRLYVSSGKLEEVKTCLNRLWGNVI